MKDLEMGINLDDLGGFTLVTGVLEVESISWLIRLEIRCPVFGFEG